MIKVKLTKPVITHRKTITAKDIDAGPCKLTSDMSPEDKAHCLQLNALISSIKYFYDRGIQVLIKPSKDGYNMQLREAGKAGK